MKLKKLSTLAGLVICVYYSSSAFGEELLISCNDEAHCDRTFYSVVRWISSNSLLPRDSSRSTGDLQHSLFLMNSLPNREVPIDQLRFATVQSSIDGNATVNGASFPKSILTGFMARFEDSRTLKISASCANVFSDCSPKPSLALEKLSQYVVDQDDLLKIKILEKAEEAKKTKEAEQRRSEERAAKKKQDINDQLGRRKSTQSIIRKTGASVCYYDLGTTSELVGKIRYSGPGLEIRGFTEDFKNQKIQVRVNSIRNPYSLNEAPVMNAIKGGLIWTNPNDWEACLD